MNSLGLRKLFRLRIDPTIISQGLILGVGSQELLDFVNTQIRQMVNYKPNCRMVAAPVWIMRGYYPGTPLFFKISVVKAADDHPYKYYCKLKSLKVNSRVKWHQAGNVINYGDIQLDSEVLGDVVTQAFETIVLGAEPAKSEPYIKGNGPCKPKCMSPKGMPLFRYKKPSVKKGKKRGTTS